MKLSDFTPALVDALNAYSDAVWAYKNGGAFERVDRTSDALMAAWKVAGIGYATSPGEIREAYLLAKDEEDARIREGMRRCNERDSEIRAAAAEQSAARWAKADAEYAALKRSKGC